MRTTALIFFIMFFFFLPAAKANPPVSIDLSYDFDRGSLHIEAVHPSFDLTKSYVRLMNIYVNGNQVSALNFYRQNDYNEFSDDEPVSAKVGDVIKVELFCTLGGSLSKEMTVTNQNTQPTGQGSDAGHSENTPDNTKGVTGNTQAN